VTHLHHEQHIGFKRLVQMCDEMFGLQLSTDGAVSSVERAGRAVQEEAEAIGEKVRQSQVIGSDETSARVHGDNWWQWVFVGENCAYHLSEPSRGYDVVEKFTPHLRHGAGVRECEAEVWVCDCWKAQLNAPAMAHQICLAHQVRNLQSLIEKRPHLAWAREVQALFRKAMRLANRRDQMTQKGYTRQTVIVEKRLERLLKRRFSGIGANLLKRYRKYQNALFVFLYRRDVPAHTAPAVGAGVTTPANAPCVLRSYIAKSWVVFAPIASLMPMPPERRF
jgi:transposase